MTDALRISAEPRTPKRRYLAPNVPCLFADERPALERRRWYGRYPEGVTSIRAALRARQLGVGDIAEITAGPNQGRRVRLLEWFRSGKEWWVGAVDERPLRFGLQQSAAPKYWSTETAISATDLRRWVEP